MLLEGIIRDGGLLEDANTRRGSQNDRQDT